MKRAFRIAAAVLAVLALACAAAAWRARGALRGSLPQLDGEIALAGLSAPVTVDRDSLGVPHLRGSGLLDVTRALGFVHAQDRFFQMDGLRRSAAGELAALVGPSLLAADRAVRVHRFRARARLALEALPPGDRALLEAYAAGVNAALALPRRPPFEYLLLRASPEPWLPEDCLLAIYAMYLELHDPDAEFESARGLMRDLLPPELAAFLAPAGTEWDAPLAGDPFAVPQIPGPEVLDLRRSRRDAPPPAAADGGEAGAFEEDNARRAGSNSWAVAGWRSGHGGAMVANDMHLDLAVPPIWYRAALSWPAGDCGCEEEHLAAGVTLPGAPAIAAGSTRRVAWGFTNAYLDWADLVIVEEDPGSPDRYLAPGGSLPYEEAAEIIAVKGAPADTLRIRGTLWGPVTGRDHRGRPRALRWMAHDPGAADLGILALAHARDLDEALDTANRCGIPPQNFVCADRGGRIGWTIIGRIPRRAGFDGSRPESWADGSRRWEGWAAPDETPRVADPPSGILWTANARVVSGEDLALLGDGGYVLGARARQIRDGLAALARPEERDLLALQLDDRALFLARWRELLLALLTPETLAGRPERAEFRRLAEEAWSGRASVESQGYRLVRTFRLAVFERVFTALLAPCLRADPRFAVRHIRQWEGPLWKLVTERPAHLLDPAAGSWEELLLDSVDQSADRLRELEGSLAAATWGARNRSAIRHPLGRAVPGAGRLLDMPSRELPGDEHMPRVQSPDDGASERMVVSPARLERALFHMPGGESGHPLSPFYRAGHDLWERGRPAPLLPGAPAHRLLLRPR